MDDVDCLDRVDEQKPRVQEGMSLLSDLPLPTIGRTPNAISPMLRAGTRAGKHPISF
jgi:hypothetical protein